MILEYIINILINFIPVFPFIVLLRLIYIKILNFKTTFMHELGFLILLFFIFSILSQTISIQFIIKNGFHIKGHQNFIPFKAISQVLNVKNISYVIVNILGNILIFLPIGFLIPLLWKKFKKWYITVLFGFIFSFFIETMQLFTIRGTDIDDLFLNTLGTVIGYILYIIINKLFNNFTNLFLLSNK